MRILGVIPLLSILIYGLSFVASDGDGDQYEEPARPQSPIPPFHLFWPPRFQLLESLINNYKHPNPTFYHVEKDPEQTASPASALTNENLFKWVNPKSQVKFWLWTRKNRHLAQELVFESPISLSSSNFDRHKPTKMIIHGWADGASEVYIGEWILDMRNAYLDLADLNIIVVDHSIHARFPFYLNSRPELVGARVGEMIEYITKLTNSTMDSFHLIGWSWGAHIAGFAGKYLNGSLARISGLDPAGPTFRYVENEHRLDSSDAKFVDIIHTNSNGTDQSTLWGGQFGLSYPLGHVDFYVNGGGKQTGCPLERTLVYETLYCSHGRAPRYWTESIQSPLAFPACLCESFDNYLNGLCDCNNENLAYMGEHLPTNNTSGNFQLITRSYPPYGHGPKMFVRSLTNFVHNELNEGLPTGNTTNSHRITKDVHGGKQHENYLTLQSKTSKITEIWIEFERTNHTFLFVSNYSTTSAATAAVIPHSTYLDLCLRISENSASS